MQQEKRIFLIEDEPDLAHAISRSLEEFGFEMTCFSNGKSALDAIASLKPDLCLVDLHLPDMDGLSIIKQLEDMPTIGSMIITGRGDISDRVLGLEFGADDYLVKPFEPRELVARVKSILRRIDKMKGMSKAHQAAQVAHFADWQFDSSLFRLTSLDGKEETLSSAEAQMLLTFLHSPNRILSREQLLESKDDGDLQPYDRSIDLRVSRLRKKIESDPKEPKILKTVYGAGYLFATEVSWHME